MSIYALAKIGFFFGLVVFGGLLSFGIAKIFKVNASLWFGVINIVILFSLSLFVMGLIDKDADGFFLIVAFIFAVINFFVFMRENKTLFETTNKEDK